MKWQRRNKPPNDAISRECANGVSNKKIAQKFHLCTSTVERRLNRNHEKLLKEQLNYPCPVVLGIDEHSICCSGAQGRKFAVTLADLRNHRIYEVFDGKSIATLEANLRRLRGREKVKAVCMDLCPSFLSIVQRLFPNAKIVADRFHVIRQVMESFLEFSQATDPDIRRKRGVTRALRTNGEKPGSAQRQLLSKLFAANSATGAACLFKEELCSLLNIKGQTKEKSRTLILRLKEKTWQLLHEAPEIFKKPGRTIRQWFEPIIRMWCFSKSNGVTEGFPLQNEAHPAAGLGSSAIIVE